MGFEIEKERRFYNAVRIAANDNHRELRKLKGVLGTWEEVWLELSRTASVSDPQTEWQKLEKAGVSLFLLDDPEFPPLLREIPWPPFGIYSIGELPESGKSAIAIVGTRKATEEGLELAHRFGFELAHGGATVVSGLAFGIDTASHQGCLEAGGQTLAVLGNGLDTVYPKSNECLARNILKNGGALMSEYPLGTPALPHHFLERNRLISGLALGVVVIEAPKASGSLATARFALEQNREVFVVPGPATHRNFYGSHQLIRSGARLVTQVPEIWEDLNLKETVQKKETLFDSGVPEEKIIFELLANSAEPLGVDKIIEITHVEPRLVNQALTMLVIRNVVHEEGEGYRIKY